MRSNSAAYTPSSVRTSSTHRSTIETRGAPEFDREYARQLSVAKRGRNGSVRPSPRPGSAQESPVDEANFGNISSSAAAAATRIKDYVATHVTPPRNFHLGTSQRANDSSGSISHTSNEASATSRNLDTTRAFTSRVGTPPPPPPTGANDEGTADAESPPGDGSSRSTRRGSAAAFPPTPKSTPEEEKTLVLVLKTIVIAVLVLFVVLCATSFLVSSDASYDPTYFHFGDAAPSRAASGSQRGSAARGRSFPDRLIPQLNRQLALHTRRMLGHVLDYIGVLRLFRFLGRAIRTAFSPVTYVWSVVAEGILAPAEVLLPRLDLHIHPTLRYIFSNSTEDAEGWTLSKPAALFAALARSLLQLFVEPVVVLFHTLQSIAVSLRQSLQLFSTPLTSQGQPIGSVRNGTAPAKAARHTNTSSMKSRLESSFLLTLWRPLHMLWALLAPTSLTDTAGTSKHWAMHVNNRSQLTPACAAAAEASCNSSSSPPPPTPSADESRLNGTCPSPPPSFAPTAEEEKEAAQPTGAAEPPKLTKESANATRQLPPRNEAPRTTPVEVRTTHTRRLSGDLWASLSEKHHEKLMQLAREDLRELFGNGVEVEKLQLRSGSLVLEFGTLSLVTEKADEGESDSSSSSSSTNSSTSRRIADRQAAMQQSRDAQVQNCPFSRLQEFYNAAATRVADAARASSALAECQRERDTAQRNASSQLQDCKKARKGEQQACEETRTAAARDAEAALRHCKEAARECEERGKRCAAELADVHTQQEEQRREKDATAAALAAAQQAMANSSAGHANASEAARQRCEAAMAEVAHNCTKRIDDVRASLNADCEGKLKETRKDCETTVQKAGEETCAGRLSGLERDLTEQSQSALRLSEAACAERLAKETRELNHTSSAALSALHREMDVVKSDAAQRLSNCQTLSNQTAAACEAAKVQLRESCNVELAAAQKSCEARTQQAMRLDCTEQLRKQEKEMTATCATALQRAEHQYREELTKEVSAFNSSAAATLAQLRTTVENTKASAGARVAACEAASQEAAMACKAVQQQLNASHMAHLTTVQQRCEAAIQEAHVKERLAQEEIGQANRTRQAASLAAQCTTATQSAVADASKQLEEQFAEAKAAQEKRAAEELQKVKDTHEQQRNEANAQHAAVLQGVETRLANCESQRRESESARVQVARSAREQLFSYVAESAEASCLQLTRHDKTVCSAERQKVEQALLTLPADAAADAVLVLLNRTSRGAAAAVPAAQLLWDFSASGVAALQPQRDRQRGRSLAPPLHLIGMLVGLASAVYAVVRRQHDRLLYKDTIAQLNALIEANETTMALRSPLPPRVPRGVRGAPHDAFPDDATVSWGIVETCLGHYTDALISWHSTCCAVLLEQEAKDLLRRQYEEQSNGASVLLQTVSDMTTADANTLSTSHHGHPLHSLVSVSTLPPSRDEADADADQAALTQMHEAFVSTYYGILEMYYVDLLNAVANRELAESQLQEAEAVAVRQAAILHKQSAAVAQLKKSLAEKEASLSHRAAATASSTVLRAAEDKLARAERQTAAQRDMIALLEGQLQISKEELERARAGVVQTPARTPRGGDTGTDGGSTARQIRSLQELADAAGGDSAYSSDISPGDRHSPQRPTAPPLSLTAAASQAGKRRASSEVHADTRDAVPVSAMKRPTSMVRDPESTRRYHKLRWDDETGVE